MTALSHVPPAETLEQRWVLCVKRNNRRVTELLQAKAGGWKVMRAASGRCGAAAGVRSAAATERVSRSGAQRFQKE